MPGKAVPAVQASASTAKVDEIEILEAEAVVISGAYPDSFPTADVVATTSSQPVLATRAPEVRSFDSLYDLKMIVFLLNSGTFNRNFFASASFRVIFALFDRPTRNAETKTRTQSGCGPQATL